MDSRSVQETFMSIKFWIIFSLAFHQTLSHDDADFSPRARSCKSIFHKPAACKSLDDCQPLLNLMKKHPFIGRRVVESSLCSFNIFDITVCCPQIDDDDDNNNTNNNQAEGKPMDRPTSVELLRSPQCGYSNVVHDRVVGGNPAALGAWPWIALIGYGKRSSPYVSFRCGGTLISSRHVLTAAHCILNGIKSVRLGELDLGSTTDGANPIDILIEKAIVHPEFDDNTLLNDIAILRLNKDVEFTDTIHPICLPLPDDVKNRNYVGTFPFVAGWGATYYDGSSSDILREVQVPVVSSARCEQSYRFIQDISINNNVLCAGYAQGGKDACQGDSGGPLMFPRNATYYLIGVVSGGYKCAQPGYPGIYTRVSSFLDFIQSHLN